MFSSLSRDRLTLEKDGRDWPLREASRMVDAGGLRWHVQDLGQGPGLLLIHGTGAATHSWRALAPLLAAHFRVISLDLPGHGFTQARNAPDLSLVGMAKAVGALLQALKFEPDVAVGHSAGAAIVARLCLDGKIAPKLFVGVNGAFLPFEGIAGQLFPSAAKLLFLNPFAPRLFAWTADRAAVERLLKGTGSSIDPQGIALYARLFANPAHVAGALGMMARWDLSRLAPELPRLKIPTLFIVGRDDRAIPPAAASKVARGMPSASVEAISGAGHLVHEERPQRVAEIMLGKALELGILSDPSRPKA